MQFECSCDFDFYYQVYNQVKRKARKEHCCYECNMKILRGEVYEYTTGIYEGSVDVYHTCAMCTELKEWVKIQIPCFCYCHGQIHEMATETVKEAQAYVGSELAGVYFSLLRKLVKIKREKKRRGPYVKPPKISHCKPEEARP